MKQLDPYEDLNVNIYGVLKPSLLLWIIMLIETWHYWGLLLVMFSDQSWLLPRETGWINFAIELPALLVLVALGVRVPTASHAFRVIWRNGKSLLTIAAIGNLAWIFWTLSQDMSSQANFEWPILLGVLLHVWAIMRLRFTLHIQKVFSEFPS